MAIPDRPDFFVPEREITEPRSGIRMVVEIVDDLGQPLPPSAEPMDRAKVVGKLSIEESEGVFDWPTETTEGMSSDFVAVKTVLGYVLSPRHGIDPRYEDAILQYAAELHPDVPSAQHTLLLDAARRSEALRPDKIGNPHVHQFILTREKPQHMH